MRTIDPLELELRVRLRAVVGRRVVGLDHGTLPRAHGADALLAALDAEIDGDLAGALAVLRHLRVRLVRGVRHKHGRHWGLRVGFMWRGENKTVRILGKYG